MAVLMISVVYMASCYETRDKILSVSSKDKGLSGARNPALPATILVKVQVHCKLLVGRG